MPVTLVRATGAAGPVTPFSVRLSVSVVPLSASAVKTRCEGLIGADVLQRRVQTGTGRAQLHTVGVPVAFTSIRSVMLPEKPAGPVPAP